MKFLVRDEKLLKSYNAIWDKSSNLLEKGFDSESVHNKYIKSKIKFYNGKINTNFYGDKIPGKNVCCVCLSAIILDSIIMVGKKDYPQVLLEERKYAVKMLSMKN